MRYTALLVILAVAACETDGPAGNGIDDAVGRYPLRTVNGSRPPVVFSNTASLKIEILDGVVNLYADGSYADSTDVRRTENGGSRVVTDVSRGSYVRSGAAILFTSTRGEEYSMTLTETSLKQDLAGSILIYRK